MNSCETTHGLYNGRFWGTLERKADLKLVFLLGVNDALTDGAPEHYDVYLPKGVTNRETIQAVDVFYVTPENLRVPIMWALSVVSLRAKGGSTEEVEALTARCRKRAAV